MGRKSYISWFWHLSGGGKEGKKRKESSNRERDADLSKESSQVCAREGVKGKGEMKEEDLMKINFVEGWLKHIAEAKEKKIIPPFVVEIVMRDHRSYYLQDVIQWDEESGTAVLRVWDLRALSDQDKEILKLRISHPYGEKPKPEDLHPYLDWANLKDIMYCIEWHDRMRPLGVEAIKMYKKYIERDKNQE